MTYAQCLADARELRDAFGDWGVRASIELQPGRGSDPWASVRKWLRMHHHTVSWYRGPDGNLTPVLGVCKNGRPGIPPPLCNGYGGYDGVYRIICMGLANHPGQGGPIVIDGVRVPEDSAREPTWGTEWEGGYQDWERITIPAYDGGMLEFMGRSDCALADWSGRPLTSQLEHSTWTPRKIDRKDFTRARGIALSQAWHPQGDDHMSAADVAALRAFIIAELEKRDNDLHRIKPTGSEGVVYHTDFKSFIRRVKVGGPLDKFVVATGRFSGENPAAIEVDQAVIDELIQEMTEAPNLV